MFTKQFNLAVYLFILGASIGAKELSSSNSGDPEDPCDTAFSLEVQQTNEKIKHKSIKPRGRVYFNELSPSWQHPVLLSRQIAKLNEIPSIRDIGGVARHALFLSKSQAASSFKIKFVDGLEAKVHPDSEEIVIIHRTTLLGYRNRWHFRNQLSQLRKGFDDTVELLKSGISMRRSMFFDLNQFTLNTDQLARHRSVDEFSHSFGLDHQDYLLSSQYAVTEKKGQFIYITAKQKPPYFGYRVAKIDDRNHTIVVFSLDLNAASISVKSYRKLRPEDDLFSFIHATAGFSSGSTPNTR